MKKLSYILGGLFLVSCLSLFSCLGFASASMSEIGSVDPSFSVGSGFSGGTITTSVLQPDGKIIVGGSFTSYRGVPVGHIVRISNNGGLDRSFNAGGTGFSDNVAKIALQADGKIVVGGDFQSYNGIQAGGIIRLNADGTKDVSFDFGSGFDSTSSVVIGDIVVQTNGSTIIGGKFESYKGSTANNIVRILPNGDLDNGFNPIFSNVFFTSNGIPQNTNGGVILNSLLLQPDGKIIVGGFFARTNGINTRYLVRLNVDGTVDGNFFVPGGLGVIPGSNPSNELILQNDGKIILAGFFTSYSGVTVNKIIRLNTNGLLDTTFDATGVVWGYTGTNGFQTTDPYSLLLQPDGKIIVGERGGASSNSGYKLKRLNTNGTLDTGFVTTGFSFSEISSVLSQPDGKVLVGQDFQGGKMLRLNAYGVSLDMTASSDDGVSNTDNTTTITSPVWTGSCSSGTTVQFLLNSTPRGSVPCPGGSYTYTALSPLSAGNYALTARQIFPFGYSGMVLSGTSFTIGVLDGFVSTSLVQSDGKIILGGNFDTYSGFNSKNIVRINTDGSIDTNFQVGAGFDDTVVVLKEQADGKILVGGQFTSYSGASSNRIARLQSNGRIDLGFQVGGGFDMPGASGFPVSVTTLDTQSDGKIIVGGFVSQYSGVTIPGIARLHSGGLLDTTFNAGNVGPDSLITTVKVQSDDKIIIGGDFQTYNNTNRSRLARLQSSGTLDTGFVVGGGLDGIPSTIHISNANRIIIGGSFTTYSGANSKNIVALQNSGVIDSSFQVGGGFDNDVHTISSNNDGSLLVGGSFGYYSGHQQHNIAKLMPNGTIDSSFQLTGMTDSVVSLTKIPNTDYTIIGGEMGFYNNNTSFSFLRINSIGQQSLYETRASQWMNDWFLEDAMNFTIVGTNNNNGGSAGGGGYAGGGGGSSLYKDNCPNGDNSASYYDNSCGTSSSNISPSVSQTQYNNQTTMSPIITTSHINDSGVCPFGDYDYNKKFSDSDKNYKNSINLLRLACIATPLEGTKFKSTTMMTEGEFVKWIVKYYAIENDLSDDLALNKKNKSSYTIYYAKAKERGLLKKSYKMNAKKTVQGKFVSNVFQAVGQDLVVGNTNYTRGEMAMMFSSFVR